MPRNYFIDDDLNRDWIKAIAKIRLAMGLKGKFVTIDGRPVFVGGPQQGAGGAGGSRPPGRWTHEYEDSREELLADNPRYWGSFLRAEDALSDEDEIDFGEIDFEDPVQSGAVGTYMGEEWGEWESELSRDEKNALREYSQEAYTPINAFLRKGQEEVFEGPEGYTYTVDNAKHDIPFIDSALERGIVSDNMVVFRGKVEKPGRLSFESGDIFTDNGYASSSLDEGMISRLFAGGHGIGVEGGVRLVTEIRVPKGSSGGYLGTLRDFSGSGRALGKHHEFEFLFPRGQQFRVVDIQGRLDIPGEARMILEAVQ